MLSESMGTSFGPLGAYAFAAVVVLALLLIVLFVAKRVVGGRSTFAGTTKGPRLAVVDVAALDQRRKLVLVRRDEVEHLVLVGGETDIVVEAGILRTAAGVRGAPRVEPELAAGMAPARAFPAVVAPEPRARPASPLRRTLPPNASKRPADIGDDVGVTRTGDAAPAVEAGREATVERETGDVPSVAPAARREMPSLAAAIPPMPEPERRPTEAEPARRPAAVEMPAERRAPTTEAERSAASPEAPQTARPADPVEPEPRVPEFLRRTDVPPRPDKEPAPVVAPPAIPMVSPVPAPAARRPAAPEPSMIRTGSVPPASPASPVVASVPVREAPPRPVAPPAPRLDAFEAPIVGPSEPVMPRGPVPPAGAQFQPPQPPQSQPVQRPFPAPAPQPAMRPGPIEGGDAAERQPLSVRSFASAIQSRRPPEAPRQPVPAPVVQPPEGGSTQGAPIVNPPRPPEARPPEPAVGREQDLDDVLARGLDNDFRSLDWGGGEKRPVQAAPAVRPDAAQVHVQAAPAVRPDNGPARERAPAATGPNASEPARRPTLEEEMEQLLGDFDFSANRRP